VHDLLDDAGAHARPEAVLVVVHDDAGVFSNRDIVDTHHAADQARLPGKSLAYNGDTSDTGLLSRDTCPQNCGRAAASSTDTRNHDVGMLCTQERRQDVERIAAAMDISERRVLHESNFRKPCTQLLADQGEHLAAFE
jgi:hypothetical protein